MVNHPLVSHVTQVHALHGRPLPSIGPNPGARRDATASDHAPIAADLDL
jgi:hypothetical protein